MACKSFNSCPLREFENKGLISEKWKENYCLLHFEKCKRFQSKQMGLSIPKNMLPDGSIVEE